VIISVNYTTARVRVVLHDEHNYINT